MKYGGFKTVLTTDMTFVWHKEYIKHLKNIVNTKSLEL